MTSFSPNSKKHAIEQAVVGIRLLEDASESEFENALKVATELKDAFDLPGQFAVDAMALMFGRQVLTMGYRSGPSEMKPGALFQCVSKSGVMESELTIERSAVTFRTSNYSRWVDMQNYINGLLAPVAAALCSGNIQRITAIELRCVDKFTSNIRSPLLTELIDSKSELIADWLKGKSDLLHSHLGWFEDVSEFGRTLVNINVDLNEVGEKRAANILQVVSRQSNGRRASFYGRKKFASVIAENLDLLHKRDKALLGALLQGSLKKAIGLEGSSGVCGL